MPERVAAVLLEPGEGDPGGILGRSQLGLVVRVRLLLAPGPRRRQPGQPGPHPSGDRSCGRPSYSCRPLYSRISATLRSHTARSRGDRSMGQTLPRRPGYGVTPCLPPPERTGVTVSSRVLVAAQAGKAWPT